MTREKAGPTHVNEIALVGRINAEPAVRVMPSGDEVTMLRLVVDRPRGHRRSDGDRSTITVDTFDIACWTARTRTRAAKLTPGDVVRVEGALRRRFHRTPTGPVSRYEVEAATLRREPSRAVPR